MKKPYTLFLILFFVFNIAACGGGGDSGAGNDNNVKDNQLPVAHKQSHTITQTQELTLTLIADDSDGSIVSYKITQYPNGELVGSGSNWRYIPKEDFSGVDTFHFTVTDDQGATSADAVVTITINKTSPLPVNNPPSAKDLSLNVNQLETLPITLLGEDADGVITQYKISQQPSHGTLSGDLEHWVYNPNNDYEGTDSFTYTVTDDDGAISNSATISITVNKQPGNAFYVATTGDNTNTGNINSPFKTIQHAINQAQADDVIIISAGTYREDVNINNKHNITIKADDDQVVIISGADLIDSQWHEVTGKPGVFVTSLNSQDIETDYTQVFVNGELQQMARFPDNTSGEMLNPLSRESGYAILTNAEKTAGNTRATVNFSTNGGLPELPDVVFSDEAVIRGLIGKLRNNIFSASTDGAAIQREGGNAVSFIGTNNGPWSNNAAYSSPEGFGYIFDLAVLDNEGEWFFKQKSNELYYQPANASMSGVNVEVKKRKWGLRLNNSSNITIKNIHVRAASMKIDGSDNLHITNCSFKYLFPFYYRDGYGVLKEGIIIDDSDNGIYENNLISSTWGSGIILNSGANNIIRNNIIEDIGWLGQFTVALFNEAENTTISHNTFGRSSRFHIRTTKSVKSTITDNDMFESMSMGEDAGSIMMTSTGKSSHLDLKDTQIAYNKIHDIYGIPAMDTSPIYNRQTVVAFYMEDVANYTIHHNLVYNLSGDYTRVTPGTSVKPDGKVVYLGPRTRNMTEEINYFNNTFYNYDGLFSVWHHDKDGQLGSISNAHIKNNIFMANKFNKASASSANTYPAIEENDLATYVQQLANTAYNYSITESNNSTLTSSEYDSTFIEPSSGNFRLNINADENSNGEIIDGITADSQVARGAWEGKDISSKERVFNAGANISRTAFP